MQLRADERARKLGQVERRRNSSTLKRAMVQAQARKLVPSTNVPAFRETTKKVSCRISSASPRAGCSERMKASRLPWLETKSCCTRRVCAADVSSSRGVGTSLCITRERNDTAARDVSSLPQPGREKSAPAGTKSQASRRPTPTRTHPGYFGGGTAGSPARERM